MTKDARARRCQVPGEAERPTPWGGAPAAHGPWHAVRMHPARGVRAARAAGFGGRMRIESRPRCAHVEWAAGPGIPHTAVTGRLTPVRPAGAVSIRVPSASRRRLTRAVDALIGKQAGPCVPLEVSCLTSQAGRVKRDVPCGAGQAGRLKEDEMATLSTLIDSRLAELSGRLALEWPGGRAGPLAAAVRLKLRSRQMLLLFEICSWQVSS